MGDTVQMDPPADLAVTPSAPVSLFGTDDPEATIAAAKRYARALAAELEPTEDRPTPLYKVIRDRRHVLIEGWTLLGTMLGIFPIETWTRQTTGPSGTWAPPTMKVVTVTRDDGSTWEKTVIDRPGEGGWEARVEARTITGQVVGAAEMECRWDESTWATRESYALRSMAQTRAASKALRMPLGFVVQLAGYDATPAEEIPTHETQQLSEYRCPSCDQPVYDNRADIKAGRRGEKFPRFKCASRTCTGGKDGGPWVSWDEKEFDEPDYINRTKLAILDLTAIAFPDTPLAERKSIAKDTFVEVLANLDIGDGAISFEQSNAIVTAATELLPEPVTDPPPDATTVTQDG